MTHLTFQERKNIKLVNNGLITKEILNNDFNNISQCIVHTITAGLLPFLISTRFKYIDLNSIIDGKDDIISIKNDSKTVWELFELFLFDKVNRNEELNWDFNKVINSDMIKIPIKNKLYDIIYKNKYTWNKNKIFNVLTENVCEFDKKTIGDVPTSYNLVKEILGHINTFGDGSCIDMTCGNGTFLWEVKRIAIQNGYDEKYVMNNIFGVDINLLKCYITSALLDPTDEYESNIYCGDALHTDTGNIFNMKKFKYIVGNPPYLKQTWIKFLKLSINLSDIIMLLSPDATKNFTSISRNLNKLLIENGIQTLTEYTSYFPKIHTGKIVCYYLNKNLTAPAQVLEDNTLKGIILNKVISYNGNNIISMLSKNRSSKYKRLPRYAHLNNNRIRNLENVTTSNETWTIIDKKNTTIINGDEYWLTNRYFGTNKNNPLIEIKGYIGIGTNILAIKKIPNITLLAAREIYLSTLYMFCINVLKGAQFDTSPSMLKQLPSLTSPPVYEHFNLTSEEIKYIEDTVK